MANVLSKEKQKEVVNKVYELNKVRTIETDKATLAKTTGSLGKYNTSSEPSFKYGTQLLGLPFQFLDATDKRMPSISKKLGRKYVENIALQAPTVIIIPGRPKYLPGAKNKTGITNALFDAANGSFDAIKEINSNDENDDLKLYDFQSAYIEYFQYVNILCRTVAGFLELDSNTGKDAYKINGKPVNFVKYDWKGYRWDESDYAPVSNSLVVNAAKDAGKSVLDVIKTAATKVKDWITGPDKSASAATGAVNGIDFNDPDISDDPDLMNAMEDTLQRANYLRFYMDPEGTNVQTTMQNSSTQSIFKQTIEGMSSTVKDVAFLIDSGGGDAEALQTIGENAINALQSGIDSTLTNVSSSAGSIISRVLSSGKSVVRGDSIMMPDIWGGADMANGFSLSFHYKAPYGNRMCEYAEVWVPVCHWIGLAYPHATTPNSYSAPYIVKCYVPGSWTVSLGLITSLVINRSVNEYNTNADGMFTEVDVEVTITELYSDMALSPANDMKLFMQNTSIVEFLATNCGLNLVESQLSTKMSMLWDYGTNAVKDLPSTVVGKITEKMDEAVMSFIGL